MNKISCRTAHNSFVVSPAAGWGHHPLNYQKVSVCSFVKGVPTGTFTSPLTNLNTRTTLPVRMMSIPKGFSISPKNSICEQKPPGSFFVTGRFCPQFLATKGRYRSTMAILLHPRRFPVLVVSLVCRFVLLSAGGLQSSAPRVPFLHPKTFFEEDIGFRLTLLHNRFDGQIRLPDTRCSGCLRKESRCSKT
jgi:hypothetical protein